MSHQQLTTRSSIFKRLSPICFTLLTALLLVMSACKSNQHASQSHSEPTINDANLPVLEVIGVYGEKDGDSVSLISLDHKMRYTTIISIANLGDKYRNLKVGDRVQLAGEYAESYPVQIFNIQSIKPVANTDKEKCEAQQGNVWKPQGKAQIPACVSTYSDAGKPCQSSTQCQGNCMVTNPKQPAVCASSSSRFGCGSTIEAFNKQGGILCID